MRRRLRSAVIVALMALCWLLLAGDWVLAAIWTALSAMFYGIDFLAE